MYYGCHSTKKIERDLLLGKDAEIIEISPYQIHGNDRFKPIVWEEDTGKYYEHDIKAFLETLSIMTKSTIDIIDTPYYKEWSYKGAEVETRLRRLPDLVKDIIENGIKEPIDIEITGERLDGSFRSKIAMFLGIKKIKARLHRFHWKDIDEDFIKRKLETRWLSVGKDYYEFDFGNGLKNIPKGGSVYQENASDRWEVLKDHIKGKVLDLGCNEGYMSLMSALKGCQVKGYDTDLTQVAWLNKLIFEWVNKKDLDCEFENKDIREVDTKGFDTTLLLNVLYHLPKEDQLPLLKRLTGNVIIQCNLRKEKEREKYYTSHPDDLKDLLKEAGYKIIKEIEWRDKPIIICHK